MSPDGPSTGWHAALAFACAAYFLLFVVAIPDAAGGPEGVLWTTAHSVFGVGAIALAAGFHRSRPASSRLPVGAVLLAASGLTALLLGIVLAFLAGSRPDPVLAANFVTILFVFPAAFVLLARNMKASGPWHPIHRPALLLAVAVPVSFVGVVLSPAEWEAALGRVTDLLLALWVLLVATNLWFVSRRQA